MKKNRLIPVVLLRNGWIVQSKGFSSYQNLGNPIASVKRLSEWASDEIIYLDISTDDKYDLRRDDQGYKNRDNFLDIIRDVSDVTFMPITVGGKIRSLSDIEIRLYSGADKVCLNTMAIEDIKLVESAVREFGSQCIIISIDAKEGPNGHKVFSHGGKRETKFEPHELATIAENSGVGEILINSNDRDGQGTGYDIQLLQQITNSVSIPVIGCGGVSEWHHFSDAFEQAGVDAVAAANIFHYVDQSVFLAKKYLFDNGVNVRKPDLIKL